MLDITPRCRDVVAARAERYYMLAGLQLDAADARRCRLLMLMMSDAA